MRRLVKGTYLINLLIAVVQQLTQTTCSTWITLNCQMCTVRNPDRIEKVLIRRLLWGQQFRQSSKRFNLHNLCYSRVQKVRWIFKMLTESRLCPRRQPLLKTKVSKIGHFLTCKLSVILWLNASNNPSLTGDPIINLPQAAPDKTNNLWPKPRI